MDQVTTVAMFGAVWQCLGTPDCTKNNNKARKAGRRCINVKSTQIKCTTHEL